MAASSVAGLSSATISTPSKQLSLNIQPNEEELPMEDMPAYDLGDLSHITSPSQVRAIISSLDAYLISLTEHLNDLLIEAEQIAATAHSNVAELAPRLQVINDEAEILRKRLAQSAATAQRISSQVGNIDERRRRVDLAATWARTVGDLKSSLLSLEHSIDQRDYDEATRHCVRAMSVDPAILKSQFASMVVPSTEQPDTPAQTLLALRKRLLEIYTRGFRAATTADKKDEQEASRFFKQFPLIGWKEEGLAVYCSFAKEMVRDSSKSIHDSAAGSQASAPHHYSRMLTQLFENMALLVDKHLPVVDRHYGEGDFAKGVMPGLQGECDREGLKILRNWEEQRSVTKKLDEIASYRFTSPSPNVLSKMAQTNSVANLKAPYSITRPGTPSHVASGTASPLPEPEGPDGREVDRILGEIAAMASRWGLYRRFLGAKLIDPAKAKKALHESGRDDDDDEEEAGVSEMTAADVIIRHSQLGESVEEKLKVIYVPLETWYLRSSIEKAHRMDDPDLTARPYTSSLVEDVFYVLRAVLSRILSTGSRSTVLGMFRTVRAVIDENYTQAVVRRMESVWRSLSGSMNVDGPRKETATRTIRTTFVVYLNVLATSAQYMERILGDLASETALSQMFAREDVAEVLAAVTSLGTLTTRLRSALRTELDQLFSILTRPRLRAVLADVYRENESPYVLDEEGFAEAEYQDVVRKRFVKGWQTVLAGFKDILTEVNYDSYFALAVDALAKPWEKLAMGMRYTELGAIRFDKDVRSVSAHLSQQTSVGVREKLARLQQMSYILNLDTSEDADEVFENGATAGIVWRLSESEVKLVQSLRI